MKKYSKNILVALLCFLVIVVLNFLLPRLLPGDPVAYLTGMAEDEMSAVQVEHYRQALHLDENIFKQFGFYLQTLVNGTLGYSFKKDAIVATLIFERLGNTLQITLPAVALSTIIGLFWGLTCGYKKGSTGDKISTSMLIVLNAVPTFLLALVFIILLCFKNPIFPYTGLNSSGVESGTAVYVIDRLYHLVLPITTLTVAAFPSRYLLMRNTAAKITQENFILYAKERGLSDHKIKFGYLLKNIAQPFITMVGMSVSVCVGGSLVIEKIFSINGMGELLNEAVYTLDYPLMQGILFVTTFIMVISIVLTDIVCILIDPKVRWGETA